VPTILSQDHFLDISKTEKMLITNSPQDNLISAANHAHYTGHRETGYPLVRHQKISIIHSQPFDEINSTIGNLNWKE
jgi:hypothetical protein